MVRDGWLADWEVLHDIANTDGLVVIGQQVQNADARRVRKGIEPRGVLFRARSIELR